jgi:vanillate O-demethylase monooxygenase subunit
VPAHTTAEGDSVVTRREMSRVKAPPFWQAAMRGNGLDPEATVDRWQRCRFVPPSSVFIDVGVALAGQGGFDARAEVKTSGIVVDLITPETETSIWYFWGLARNFRPEDKALTASIREAQGKVFMEDLEMLESQQRNLLSRPERKLLSLNTDLGGVQARRIVERLVEQERAAAASAA